MRGSLAGLLALVGLVLLPLADATVWTRRQLLDRNRFIDLATEVSRETAVRSSLVDRITQEIEKRVRLSPNAIAVVRPAVANAMSTPEFEMVLQTSLGNMHDQLDRGDDQLTLDFSSSLPVIRASVGRVDPTVADKVPATLPVITVVKKSQVPALWTVVDLVRRESWVFLAASLLALAAAVVVAERRAVMLVVIGAATLFLAVVLVLVIKVGRDPLSNIVGPQVQQDAFNAGYADVTSSFLTQTLLMGLGGVVVAGAGVGLLAQDHGNQRPSGWA
jgi:hypothetical protein